VGAGGFVLERLPRRRGALILGILLFGATSALAVFVTTSGQLIAVRALMGIGAAFVFPATLAILINVFKAPKERAMAIGIWSGITGMAVAAGPVAGGFLLEHYWWGSVFLVNVPIVGIGLLVWAIIEGPRFGWTSQEVLAAGISAIALLAFFAWWETKSVHPLLDVRLFRNPRFSAASAAIATAFFGLFGFIFLITQFL
jgi:DHA2 family multidrug resistance protein-like MFS transporter